VKPLKPEQFLAFTRKRLPSREKIETIRAIGITLSEEGDDFGKTLEVLAENLLEIRQAAHGGKKNPRGSLYWEDI